MNILKLLNENEAILKGHFLLSSGLHSDTYIQCAMVLQYPEFAAKIAKEIAKKVLVHCDVVVSPALGGIVIGYEVARHLKSRAVFCERENGQMNLRRGFEIRENEKCIIVEDVITTGLSTKEVAEVVSKLGGKVMGIFSIIDRSQLKNFCVSLLKLDVKTYKPEDCPLCHQGIPYIKPGSRKE